MRVRATELRRNGFAELTSEAFYLSVQWVLFGYGLRGGKIFFSLEFTIHCFFFIPNGSVCWIIFLVFIPGKGRLDKTTNIDLRNRSQKTELNRG